VELLARATIEQRVARTSDGQSFSSEKKLDSDAN
jgi:hypothetical protein